MSVGDELWGRRNGVHLHRRHFASGWRDVNSFDAFTRKFSRFEMRSRPASILLSVLKPPANW